MRNLQRAPSQANHAMRNIQSAPSQVRRLKRKRNQAKLKLILQFACSSASRVQPTPHTTPDKMVSTGMIASLALAGAACINHVEGHTYLTQPLAEFKKGASMSSWVDQFSPPWSGTFKTGAQYAAVAPSKGYKDLKSFLDDKGPTCGNTLPNAKAKAIPSDGTIKLASSMEHPGPCEIWLGNVRAFHNDDCNKQFGDATSFKIDFSACKGNCMLRFYWLGLQDGGKRWQSYKNCIPLSSSGSSSATSSKKKSSKSTKSSSKLRSLEEADDITV
ncbi:hypothetical protein FI667_g9829, partial [Globisporangium splendens]